MSLLNKARQTLLSAHRMTQVSSVRNASSGLKPNKKWFLYAIPPCGAIILFVIPSYPASKVQRMDRHRHE